MYFFTSLLIDLLSKRKIYETSRLDNLRSQTTIKVVTIEKRQPSVNTRRVGKSKNN